MSDLSLLSLISRNSPKQLGMVSPELPNRDDPACHVLSVGRASPSPFGPISGERGFPRASSWPVLPWIGQDPSCRETVDPANPARGSGDRAPKQLLLNRQCGIREQGPDDRAPLKQDIDGLRVVDQTARLG